MLMDRAAPPARDIIPGLLVNFRSSLISEAFIFSAFMENFEVKFGIIAFTIHTYSTPLIMLSIHPRGPAGKPGIF